MLPACALFDLDGTLIDHFRAIHRCHTHAMTTLGLPPPTMAQVRAAVGGGVELAAERLVGRELKAAALAVYRPYWDATMLQDVDLLPGVLELLRALRQHGTRTAVFTNKHGPSSRLTCDHLGITPLLDGNFGATDTPWLKPDPAWTRQVLAQLGAQPGTTLLVGDSPFDVQTAQHAGLAFIGVTTGTHDAAELRAAGATRVCANLPEVARELGL
ncbi:Phosphoglycolate phosphatase [Lacunisphaera limnophila]|uniref:phosphoglycolate phosphatase n=1 Tax=Lacunisphaera limnophila TaxID=1838286 RepID=A0A1D8ARU3_9BACT|nr:HAD family hydrolase [Lacunisphaera limnophila]AOS43618.1 Phosphoglycolate phosphatase [Lacunisphaera limnophila]